MSESLEDLDRRIEAATELHSITRTMRGLAAVNITRYQRAAASTTAYESVIEDGLQVVLRDGGIERIALRDPAPDAPTAVIVFGSNQGLCGGVNRHVVNHAKTTIDRIENLELVASVGARLHSELDIAGITSEVHWDLPATLETITSRAEHVLSDVEGWRSTKRAAVVQLVFPRFRGRNRGYAATAVQLTPTDRRWLESIATRPWPPPVLPIHTIDWDEIVAQLMRQALFVRLHRAFANTMASVASSRLAAMDAAQANVEERINDLGFERRQLRQSQITDELLDVVAGFETLEGQP